jgi:uncharacterized protein YdhG (YjbR/CyaY superfamily)
MQSKAANVAAYIEEQPAEQRPVLSKLRALIRKAAAHASEGMQYGMPTYLMDGTMLCAFALQKGYLAFYLCDTAVVARFKSELGTKDCGKSCIRYRKPGGIPLPVIGRMLKVALDGRKPAKKA